MIGRILTIFILFTFSPLVGQTPSELLSSPYRSVYTHLHYLEGEHYNDSLAALPFNLRNRSLEEAKLTAVKFKQILDGQGIYLYLGDVPESPGYFDSTLHKHRYVLTEKYPDIYLEKSGNRWVYSETSIAEINKIHQDIFRFGSEKLLKWLPRLGTKKIFGLYLYQYLGILILILISVIGHKLFSYLFNRLFLKLVTKAGYEQLANGYLFPLARPASMFAVLLFVLIFIPVLQLPSEMSWVLMKVLRALVPFFGTLVFYRLVNIISLYLEKMAQKTKSTLDDQLVPLLRKTLKTFVVLIGTLFILTNLDIDIIPLLTGLSIGGLAFALAAQDTIKNFFGSLMIFIDKPFQIGDWITSGEIDGSVEEVGFRSSRIRTFRNSVMYVPNSKLADSVIDNHGLRQYRRFYTQLALTYDTPPEVIEAFVEGLRKIVAEHPDTRKDYYQVYFNDMAAFSLNVMFYIFFEVPDWPSELKARQEILLEIVRLADKLGVNFAFPTQTLHMETFPGQPALSPVYAGKEELKARLGEHFPAK